MDYRQDPRKTSTISPITSARLASGLTQAQLAERIGVAPQHIGRWERGERKPKFDALLRIADALNCDVNTLIERGGAQ